MNDSPLLQLDAIAAGYNGQPVVEGLSFALRPGQIGCLLGASGCGKTTVLRAIAGFEPLLAGTIALKGECISAPGLHKPAHLRRFGMVFQDYALFGHMSVAANIGFGLHELGKAERAARVGELLELVQLTQQANAFPHELSGGQQQRVALARALAPKPLLVLMDEPFSNLDAELRESLGLEVRALLKAQNTTAILVTHDQHEAFAIADEVGVMRAGRIEQWASPYRLYHEPATRYIAGFIGEGVLVGGKRCSDGRIELELGELEMGDLGEQLVCCGEGEHVDVLLRPDDIVHDDLSPVTATVLAKAFRGAEFLYTLQLPSGTRVLSLVPSHHNHRIGEAIGIKLELDHTVAFDRASPEEG